MFHSSCSLITQQGNWLRIFYLHWSCSLIVYPVPCCCLQRGSYGLSEDLYGCKLCNCDVGGALSDECNVTTGQCYCKPNIQGTQCTMVQPGFFFAKLDWYTYEGEFAEGFGVSIACVFIYCWLECLRVICCFYMVGFRFSLCFPHLIIVGKWEILPLLAKELLSTGLIIKEQC